MVNKTRLLITVSEFMFSSQVRNLYDLLSLIDTDMFEVEIGALRTEDDAGEMIRSLGFPVFQLRLQPTRPIRPGDALTLLKGPLKFVSGRYDVVHSLLYQSIFTEALVAKVLGRSKYIYTKSNLEWDNHPFNWKIKSRLSDAIISISRATDELLDEKGFGDKRKTIYLGIDTVNFSRDFDKRRMRRHWVEDENDAFVFGCAAQLVEWKEHLTLIEAFETVADQHSNAYLVFCGFHREDDYYREFQRRIKESRHSERIRYLGTLSDMPEFYSSIDCFVLPSRYETFGYVYVEAMSCQLPVIACNAAGPLDIVENGQSGLLVGISQVSELAAAMSRYVSDKDAALRHGARGRDIVIARFSKEKMASQSQELYKSLLLGRHSSEKV